MKDVFTTKCRLTLIISYLNIDVDFAKDLRHNMIEKWKERVDTGEAFGALMTDLSKAFDCLHHELLIAKLDAYGFDIKSVKLIQQYLSNRKQRVKVGNTYSSWKDIFLWNSTGINPWSAYFQHLFM